MIAPMQDILSLTRPPYATTASGDVFWLTGLSGAGKSTLCLALSEALSQEGDAPAIVDADAFRAAYANDLGFTLSDRAENVRRMALHAAELAASHRLVLVAAMAPLRSMREEARSIIGRGFVEVFISAPLTVCRERDCKGLYARFEAGLIQDMTGLDSPYEEPAQPDLICHTGRMSISECVHDLMSLCHSRQQCSNI